MIPRRWAHVYPGEWSDIRQWMHEDLDASAIAQWEKALAGYVGVPHAAAIQSGREGMAAILEHLAIQAGDEVIVPAYTFAGILPLIAATGATAVPADIDPATYNVTPETIAPRMTSRTRAILVLHVFGNPCRVDEIAEQAASRCAREVVVIEDCAHALGSTLRGRPVGTFGSAAFYSFEMNKVLNTFGGGVVAGRDEDLVSRVRRLNQSMPAGFKSFRRKITVTRLEQFLIASNLGFPLFYIQASPWGEALMNGLYRWTQHQHQARERFSFVQARLGLRKLASLDERCRTRRDRAALMSSLLRPEIRPQRVSEDASSNFHFYVVRLPAAAAPVRRRLLLRGIDASVKSEVMDDCAERLGFHDCPNARAIYDHAMALPMFDGLAEAAVHRAARALNSLV